MDLHGQDAAEELKPPTRADEARKHRKHVAKASATQRRPDQSASEKVRASRVRARVQPFVPTAPNQMLVRASRRRKDSAHAQRAGRRSKSPSPAKPVRRKTPASPRCGRGERPPILPASR